MHLNVQVRILVLHVGMQLFRPTFLCRLLGNPQRVVLRKLSMLMNTMTVTQMRRLNNQKRNLYPRYDVFYISQS